jgi:hypothetical protein
MQTHFKHYYDKVFQVHSMGRSRTLFFSLEIHFKNKDIRQTLGKKQ